MSEMDAIGQYAGAIGIILAIVAFVLRKTISENVLAQLAPDRAYAVVRLVIVLLFLLGAGALGLNSWRQPHLPQQPQQAPPNASNSINAGGDFKGDQTVCSSGNARATTNAGGDVVGNQTVIAGQPCPTR
jgi:hypothetical protein